MKFLFISFYILLSAISTINACSVPVFRYALERWEQDLFSVHVFYKDSLTSSEKSKLYEFSESCSKIVDPEKALGDIDLKATVNAVIVLVNIEKEMDQYSKFVFELKKSENYPRSVVRFAFKTRINTAIWDGPLMQMSFRNIADSPIRKKIAKRLIDGESVVWVLLKSGNAKEDQKALKILEKGLDTSRSTITLQEMTEEDIRDYISETRPSVKLSLSYVTIEAKDSQEPFFADMIRYSEPRLAGKGNQPILVPFFGRGRSLYLLSGEGITTKNILDANGFLCGPCACTIKDGNPGTDCLFSADWNHEITDTLVQNEPMPPLQGFEGFISSQSENSTTDITKSKQGEQKTSIPANAETRKKNIGRK